MNWGDGTEEATSTTEKGVLFSHTDESEGEYVPFIEVTVESEGGEETLLQRAPPPSVKADLPNTPTGLSVYPIEGGNTYLTWDIVDPSPDETYNVYWSLRSGASRPELLAEGISGNSHTDQVIAPTIAPGISIYYSVTAVRGGLESSFSNDVEWTGIPVMPPSPLVITFADDDRIDLSWEDIPDVPEYDVLGYRLYKAGEPGLQPGDFGV